MDDLFMVLGSFALFIGLPVSVVWFIVRKIKRYQQNGRQFNSSQYSCIICFFRNWDRTL